MRPTLTQSAEWLALAVQVGAGVVSTVLALAGAFAVLRVAVRWILAVSRNKDWRDASDEFALRMGGTYVPSRYYRKRGK